MFLIKLWLNSIRRTPKEEGSVIKAVKYAILKKEEEEEAGKSEGWISAGPLDVLVSTPIASQSQAEQMPEITGVWVEIRY